MAKVTFMPGFVQEVHGSLGKNSDLVFRTINGTVNVYKKSERKVMKPKTKVQMDHQERFKLAHEALQIVNGNALLKRLATLRWRSVGKKYATMRGWLMAELMKV